MRLHQLLHALQAWGLSITTFLICFFAPALRLLTFSLLRPSSACRQAWGMSITTALRALHCYIRDMHYIVDRAAKRVSARVWPGHDGAACEPVCAHVCNEHSSMVALAGESAAAQCSNLFW